MHKILLPFNYSRILFLQSSPLPPALVQFLTLLDYSISINNILDYLLKHLFYEPLSAITPFPCLCDLGFLTKLASRVVFQLWRQIRPSPRGLGSWKRKEKGAKRWGSLPISYPFLLRLSCFCQSRCQTLLALPFLLGSKYHSPGLLPCKSVEIGQIHTTIEISFITTDAQNK